MEFNNVKALRLFAERDQAIKEMAEKSEQMKDPSNYESIRASIEGFTKNAFPGKSKGKSIQINFFGSRKF